VTRDVRARQGIRRCSGATLMELMVVVGVVGVLAAMLLPAMASTRGKARKIQCIGNLRQMGQASLVYAVDDARRSLSGRTEAADVSMGYLHPLIRTTRPFVCPATRNSISTRSGPNPFTGMMELVDLQGLASGREATHGLSYLSHAFIGHWTPYWTEVPQGGAGTRILPYLRKTTDLVVSYQKYHDAFGLAGVEPGPSRFWLVADNYWMGDVTAYPDEADNHGAAGVHVVYCDGHVEWVPHKSFLFQYEMDADEGRVGVPLTY